MYTEEVLSRLNNPALLDENNPARKVLDGTLGEFLEHFDNHLLDMFLTRADGSYLDAHGKDFGIYRRENESDDNYRNRILLERSMLDTTSDFNKLDVSLWVYFDDVMAKNQLTSRNEYLKEEHDPDYVFLSYGDDFEYISNKFILNDIKFI